ncbi:hypothetical protein SmJEL517_g05627 [Synchytrium microbalum]|uniref:ribonuclease H n=1 Tax=Synchytrium microbalum TaxID=1806994 RepID=A0A507BN36_9FUNG|nr:uncharacterized protein SmJEL517_g05627 [Synchytrium microbalum]TPX30947.1 hypothetical protein SmJEL517_g05627 [Synchytrium microbalum]
MAGIGVFFGDNRRMNLSESPIPGKQTNQRAELYAVIRALQRLAQDRNLDQNDEVVIWVDSEYVSKGWNEWLPNWQENDWYNSQGNQVANQDLWQKLIGEVNETPAEVSIQKVAGHAGVYGNERADELAKSAI